MWSSGKIKFLYRTKAQSERMCRRKLNFPFLFRCHTSEYEMNTIITHHFSKTLCILHIFLFVLFISVFFDFSPLNIRFTPLIVLCLYDVLCGYFIIFSYSHFFMDAIQLHLTVYVFILYVILLYNTIIIRL